MSNGLWYNRPLWDRTNTCRPGPFYEPILKAGYMMNFATKRRCLVCVLVVFFVTSNSALGGEDAGRDSRGDAPFVEQSDVFVSGQDGYHTYRIPALVVSKQGTVLAFCEGRKTSSADHGDIDLLLRRSFDGGKSWQETQLVHEEGGAAKITIGNPCAIVDRDGTIHLIFSRNNARAFYVKSVDDGATFSVPREITDAFRAFSFEWTRLASGPGHGIQTRAGRIVVPVWLNDRIGKNYRSAVIYSDDAGATWTAGGMVKPTIRDCNECMAVERVDGSIHMNLRNKSAKCRAVASSTDGGITWTEPTLIEELVDPICQASIVRFSSRSGDGKGGILFSNAASRSRDHMTVKLSYDGGDSWPIAKLIHPGPSAYSDVAIAKDKTILCLFERGSKHPYEKLTVARFSPKWLTSETE